jgi:hypothetical protein
MIHYSFHSWSSVTIRSNRNSSFHHHVWNDSVVVSQNSTLLLYDHSVKIKPQKQNAKCSSSVIRTAVTSRKMTINRNIFNHKEVWECYHVCMYILTAPPLRSTGHDTGTAGAGGWWPRKGPYWMECGSPLRAVRAGWLTDTQTGRGHLDWLLFVFLGFTELRVRKCWLCYIEKEWW